jgi:hypothetical protein
MHRATPKIRQFATRLIANEAQRKSPESKTPPAFLVCEKLRVPLATLMGNAGFRALLSRALALASAEIAWLHGMHVSADFAWEELDEHAAQVDPADVAKGGVVLVAQLLALLQAFIGENLTLQLVREVWPEMSADDLDAG